MGFNDFSNKKVLITGGLGFIGSNLAIKLVALGADVTLIDSLIPTYGGNVWNVEPIKDKVRINISDVRDPYAIKHLISGQHFLFNLAGQTSHVDSMENPQTDLAINAQAQLHILEACRHHNPDIKVVFASTRQIYGRPIAIPVNEDHPLDPVDINGIHKLAADPGSDPAVDQYLRTPHAGRGRPANLPWHLDPPAPGRSSDSGLWRWRTTARL